MLLLLIDSNRRRNTVSLLLGTIERRHVGKNRLEFGRRSVSVHSAIGQVQPIDVGKRVYMSGWFVIQVENNEQRDRRLAREGDEHR
jgi:hypothetical protein